MGAQGKGWCSVARRWSGPRFAIAAALIVLASGALPGSAGAGPPVTEWPPGALDPGFASGGVLAESLGTTVGPQEGRDAVIQPDGKVIVLTTSASANYLSRYLPDGEPDGTFGSGGTVALSSHDHNGYSVLALDAKGRIVVTGVEPAPPWQAPDKSLELLNRSFSGVVYRFLPDGSLDSSFGTNGKTIIAVPPPEGLTPGSVTTHRTAVLTSSDGSITVGGAVSSVCAWEVGAGFSQFWEESGTFVARLSPDGSPQNQFGTSGLVSTHGQCNHDPGALPESFGALAQTSPETVLTLSNHPEDNTWRFRTYSPTGTLSETQTQAPGGSPVQVAVLPDHDLLVGTFGAEVVRKFTAQGIPDPAFGTNGSITTPSMSCEWGPGCFTVLPDGRILIAGRLVYGGEIGIRRYLADGSVDESFGAPPSFGGGDLSWAKLPGGNEMDTVNKLLISHGEPLVVGAEQVSGSGYADAQTALTLFQADGHEPETPVIAPPDPPPYTPPPPPAPPGPAGGGPGGGINTGSTLGGSVGGGGKRPSGGGQLGHAALPSAAVRADLAAVLSPRALPTISGLLRRGAFSLSFNAPEPGVLTVQWTTLGAQAAQHASRESRPVTVATGSRSFSGAGRVVIVLRLSAAGRKLLRRARTVRLMARALFKSRSNAVESGRLLISLRGSL